MELRKAEWKCNILAEIDEDFWHVVDDLEQRYATQVRVTVVRPVISGGAGAQRIVLAEGERVSPLS